MSPWSSQLEGADFKQTRGVPRVSAEKGSGGDAGGTGFGCTFPAWPAVLIM